MRGAVAVLQVSTEAVDSNDKMVRIKSGDGTEVLFGAIEIRLHTFVDETSADGPIVRRIIREFFVTRITAVRALRYGHVSMPTRCGTLPSHD